MPMKFLFGMRIQAVTQNQRGFTLVEVLASIVLFSIVATLAYSVYFFGVETFQKANQQSQLQDNARIVSHVITNKVRFASEVKLLQACPTTFQNNVHYICLTNGDKGIVEHIYNNATSSHTTSMVVSENTEFSGNYALQFQKKGDHLLAYTIRGQVNERTFEVTSQVSLLNVELNGGVLTTDSSAVFTAISYKSA